MTIVVFKDVRVRVRVEAEDRESITGALEDIRSAVQRAAGRRVLTRRYKLNKDVMAYSATIESVSFGDL